MSNTIYLACIKLPKINGGYDLDPCIDPTNQEDIKMLACNDLIALQIENKEALDALRFMECDVVIAPISLETYISLENELKDMLKSVNENIAEAAEKMAKAYKLVGIEFNENEIIEKMKSQVTANGSSGKVLNENLELVERADNYVVYGNNDDYDEDYEEDEEDYEEDDFYEEEDYDEDDE